MAKLVNRILFANNFVVAAAIFYLYNIKFNNKIFFDWSENISALNLIQIFWLDFSSKISKTNLYILYQF